MLAVAKEDVPGEGFLFAIDSVSKKLGVLYKHPVNAEFGHFLFEALAAVISTLCTKDKSNIDKMEGLLLPLFSRILLEPDSDTYSPYVFQVST